MAPYTVISSLQAACFLSFLPPRAPAPAPNLTQAQSPSIAMAPTRTERGERPLPSASQPLTIEPAVGRSWVLDQEAMGKVHRRLLPVSMSGEGWWLGLRPEPPLTG